jgi:hypothetical protein
LGNVVYFGGELAGDRIGGDLEGLTDEDAEFFVSGDQVEGEEVPVGIFLLARDEKTPQHLLAFDKRRFDFDRTDLGFGVATAACLHGGCFVFGLRASLEAFGYGRVGGKSLGQGDDGLFQLGLDEAFGIGDAFVFEAEVELEAGRGGRGVGGWFAVHGRRERQPVAALHRRQGGACRKGERVVRFSPGVEQNRAGERRPRTGGGQGEEGGWAFLR